MSGENQTGEGRPGPPSGWSFAETPGAEPAAVEPMEELFAELVSMEEAAGETAFRFAPETSSGEGEAGLEQASQGADSVPGAREDRETAERTGGEEALIREPELSAPLPDNVLSTQAVSAQPDTDAGLKPGESRRWPGLEAAEEARLDQAARPLPPQPPIDLLFAAIDEALESAHFVIPAAEGPSPSVSRQRSQWHDYIVFSMSGGEYAVPVGDIAEIARVPLVTRVPNVPDFVRGVTNLRGEIIPVLNLALLVGLPDTTQASRGRVLFVQARRGVSPAALLVDDVKGIQRLQSQQFEQVNGLVDDKLSLVLRGVHGRGDRLLNILDLEQLFRLPEIRQLEKR